MTTKEQYEQNKLDFINKYDASSFNSLPHKSGALLMLGATMQRIPAELTFSEEMNQLKMVGKIMEEKRPILHEQLNDFQEEFILNRKIDIIKKNENSPLIRNKINLKEKVLSCDTMAMMSINMISNGQVIKDELTVKELSSDLYDIVLLEYQLYKENSSDSLFDAGREKVNLSSPTQATVSSSGKQAAGGSGCVLNLILIIGFATLTAILI